MAHSVLLIPVREAEFVVRPRLERLAPTYLPAGPDDVAAHITLLRPFAGLDQLDDGMVSELLSFFADVTPFEFRLTKVGSFPGGVTYLAPDPASPFRQLTHELSRQFPEFPPYDGEFDQVVPHLSVGTAEHSDPPDQVASELRFRLPITAHAQEAALYWYEQEGCRVVESFPFGTTAA